MSQVLTTKQLEGVLRTYIGYQEAVRQEYRTYRVLQGAGPGDIIQAFLDAISQTDSAYELEEYAIWQSWIDGVYGLGGSLNSRTDAAWERGWKLHKFPPGYLEGSPSPLSLLHKDIEAGRVPVLPQFPQKRVRLNCQGAHRTIRIKD